MVAGTAWADDDKEGKPGKGRRGEMRKKLLEKFDADGDGKLNDDEKAKAREAMRKRRGDKTRGDRKPGDKKPGSDKAREGRRPGKGGPGADFRKKMLEKYDADKDGKLNEEERGKAREEMKKHFKERRAEMLKKFDKDGDGKLSEEERKALHEAMKKRHGDRKPGEGRPGGPGKGPRGADFRKKMIEKFDADGDGKLNEEERAKARESFKKRAKSAKKDKEEV